MAPKLVFPLSISGYSVLPIDLPPMPSFQSSATHYIYLRPHEPRVPDADSARSLFVVNVPVTATETHLRHLFGAQLSSGRVERVEFHDTAVKKPPTITVTPTPVTNAKKRKRDSTEELQVELDTIELPRTWDRELHPSGAHAVVIFVDPSQHGSQSQGGEKGGEKSHQARIQRVQKPITNYDIPHALELLRTVNNYMSIFGRFEEARAREAAKGAEGGGDEGLAEKHKEKTKGLEDFYRFQTREKRKERQTELLRKFEEDKRKVEDMRRRRGKVRPE
ncbi:meiotic recombination protein DMC1 [Blastomyces gilchristii SLH14081]|uniref:Meiotic recombination protein DMC1 n=1 Tax=Blastomyces gilchristii (strain SLH14081) TaxID=559298 RepID=A0A179UIX5_BLAGS|nr:meiotic recombination protein DMC1 [Blastomyces gilchristii SLH14081]OAT08016.1 meiotic recombination protein DMC1 [Blastomyces gilchristii SLH14081]